MDEDGFSDPRAFAVTVERVQAYVRREPGAWAELSGAAREDPDGMTRALLALGTVLLDIAAGAFRLSPDEMLRKVSRTLATDDDEGLQAMAQQ
jgi:hypothetical protein